MRTLSPLSDHASPDGIRRVSIQARNWVLRGSSDHMLPHRQGPGIDAAPAQSAPARTEMPV